MNKKPTKTQKRPGPKPELFSLYPLKFDEALDILVKAKPKRNDKEAGEETKEGTRKG